MSQIVIKESIVIVKEDVNLSLSNDAGIHPVSSFAVRVAIVSDQFSEHFSVSHQAIKQKVKENVWFQGC